MAVIWEAAKMLFALPSYQLPHLHEIALDFLREGAGGEHAADPLQAAIPGGPALPVHGAAHLGNRQRHRRHRGRAAGGQSSAWASRSSTPPNTTTGARPIYGPPFSCPR